MSRPARALWIEMPKGYRLYTEIAVSRPARALWIEIYFFTHKVEKTQRRGPRGPCGLKSPNCPGRISRISSRPARALWIEIRSD